MKSFSDWMDWIVQSLKTFQMQSIALLWKLKNNLISIIVLYFVTKPHSIENREFVKSISTYRSIVIDIFYGLYLVYIQFKSFRAFRRNKLNYKSIKKKRRKTKPKPQRIFLFLLLLLSSYYSNCAHLCFCDYWKICILYEANNSSGNVCRRSRHLYK